MTRVALCLAAISVLIVSGCQKGPSATDSAAPTTVAPETVWPASLKVLGDGFPAAGSSCRRVGETEATSDFLDDSASLVGCPSDADAVKLGGKVVGKVDGIVLVSVPNVASPVAGDGDGQGDAKVAGTDYNATGSIQCAGYRKHPAGMCPAGVKRNREGGLTIVDITWPNGDSRMLMFKDGKVISADTSQADGSAAYNVEGKRQDDETVVTIGPERYVVPDVFILGD